MKINCHGGLLRVNVLYSRCKCPYFDVDLRVHLPQVVHHTVQVQFSSSQDDVLSRLFHLKHDQVMFLDVQLRMNHKHVRLTFVVSDG